MFCLKCRFLFDFTPFAKFMESFATCEIRILRKYTVHTRHFFRQSYSVLCPTNLSTFTSSLNIMPNFDYGTNTFRIWASYRSLNIFFRVAILKKCCKTSSALEEGWGQLYAARNWTNFSPQTDATTFALAYCSHHRRRINTESKANCRRCFWGENGCHLLLSRLCSRLVDNSGLGQL